MFEDTTSNDQASTDATLSVDEILANAKAASDAARALAEQAKAAQEAAKKAQEAAKAVYGTRLEELNKELEAAQEVVKKLFAERLEIHKAIGGGAASTGERAPRTPGLGAAIKALHAEGKTREEMKVALTEKFPECNTIAQALSNFFSDLKKKEAAPVVAEVQEAA